MVYCVECSLFWTVIPKFTAFNIKDRLALGQTQVFLFPFFPGNCVCFPSIPAWGQRVRMPRRWRTVLGGHYESRLTSAVLSCWLWIIMTSTTTLSPASGSLGPSPHWPLLSSNISYPWHSLLSRQTHQSLFLLNCSFFAQWSFCPSPCRHGLYVSCWQLYLQWYLVHEHQWGYLWSALLCIPLLTSKDLCLYIQYLQILNSYQGRFFFSFCGSFLLHYYMPSQYPQVFLLQSPPLSSASLLFSFPLIFLCHLSKYEQFSPKSENAFVLPLCFSSF